MLRYATWHELQVYGCDAAVPAPAGVVAATLAMMESGDVFTAKDLYSEVEKAAVL